VSDRRIEGARDSGVDLTLLIEKLRITPPERVNIDPVWSRSVHIESPVFSLAELAGELSCLRVQPFLRAERLDRTARSRRLAGPRKILSGEDSDLIKPTASLKSFS
jgi:hypothetical protein